MFSTKDRKYFKSNNIPLTLVKDQLLNFKNGFKKLNVIAPATVGNGIIKHDEETVHKFVEEFNFQKENISIVKMVPASGAASRMFQQLYEFKEKYTGSEDDFLAFHSNHEIGSMYYFFNNLHVLPFYQDLKDNLIERGYYIEKLIEKCEYKFIIDEILSEDGLNYAKMPKGLIKFHSHKDSAVTPIEEHLVEAAHYCRNKKGNAYVHFTVSEEHLKAFKKHLRENRKKYEKKHNTNFKVSFSIQKKSTDTISMYFNNQVVRDEKGLPLLRQSGHGALIENLNEIKSDLIFIKNIDNVLPDRLKPETYKYKAYLGGLLLALQDKIFRYLQLIEKSSSLTKEQINEILIFCKEKLNIITNDDLYYQGSEEISETLYRILNRPIRVCGMVINKGEPGGGPFWVETPNKSKSLQIVEKSQIDTEDIQKDIILQNSTHFNPVDIVCGVKNYKGKKFDLTEFVDKSTGFITEKAYKGKRIKTQELPGLWNGAMSNWITIFAEVPIETFSPVKTVQDLFKIEHRNLLK